MTLYALASPGGSPGVTTTALALALSWPSEVIVAECDPSGGDVLAGLFAGHLPAVTGLPQLAAEAAGRPDAAVATLWSQLTELDTGRTRFLLPGLSDPRQAAGIGPSWVTLAAALAAVRCDVIADCGRFDPGQPSASVLAAAAVVVLVVRPTLRQLSKARQRVEMLAELRQPAGPLSLLLIGSGAVPPRDAERALGLPLAGALPDDARTASVLSDGHGRRGKLSHRPLLRAAAAVGRSLRAAAAAAPAGDVAALPEGAR
jgi:hypothetical protein